MPAISIIIPVYKVESYLHRCVDSILGQTFRDLDIILVDDGSPDGCSAVCDEYTGQDSRIHVIHQPNMGQALARNHGLDWAVQNSDSEWIMFVDSDDWIRPVTLSRLYEAAQAHRTGIAVCGYEETTGTLSDLPEPINPVLIPTESFYRENNMIAVVPWAKLYRKSLWNGIRYPDVRVCEDEFIAYKILFRQNRLAFIDQPLYAYYHNVNGVMKSPFSFKERNEVVCEAFTERAAWFARTGNRTMTRWAVNTLLLYLFQLYVYAVRNDDAAYREDMGKLYRKTLRQYALQAGIRQHLRLPVFVFPAGYKRYIDLRYQNKP